MAYSRTNRRSDPRFRSPAESRGEQK